MKNQNNYLASQIAQNKIELTKAENITREIKENVKYKLHNDGLILL